VGKLSERCAAIARRCGDLSPLAAPVRERLVEGNRAAVLAGVSPDGRPVAPLAASTLKRRRGTGPPRAPRGAASRVVAGYVVAVDAGPGRLTFTGSWPAFPQVDYLDRGTRRMPPRPTYGFRGEDLDAVRAMLRGHVTEGK
jgi:hypothetical protein